MNREGLVGDVGSCPGHSDHEDIEFNLVNTMRKKGSRGATLDFQQNKPKAIQGAI